MALPNQPIVSPLLVGRARESEYLEQALAAARQGRGAMVLLAGEAGLGKSRLAREAHATAVRDGFDVLVGHCFEDDAGFAYAPIIDALRAWFAPLPEATVATLLGVRAADAVRLLPELAHIVPDMQPQALLDGEAEKRRLMESLYHLLVQSTLPPQSTPLLLIMEDLHWSDASSLDLLYLLARRTAHLPLVVIGTYRHEESLPHLRHWLMQLARERLAHTLVLRALGPDEVGEMVQAIFGLAHAPQAETVAGLHNLTDGNPFFIEELLKVQVASGSIFLQDGQWARRPLEEFQVPESIQDAVYRRTAWLSPEAQHVLTLAAIAGRRFDFALLQQVTGHREPALLALVKELVAAQMVVEESADRFAFRHALTQKAVYAGLLARERRSLHQTIGVALERLYATALEGQAVYLSHHFFVAGEWEKALAYARQAGEQAQALCEPRAALEQWTRALAAADHLPHQPARIPLLRGRGWANEMLGQMEAARSDYEATLHLAHSAADRQAEWQALLDLGSLWSAQDYAQAGDYFQQALDLARRSGNGPMLAHSLNRVGNWRVNLDQPHTALACHQEALHIFQDAEDSRGQAATFDFLGMAAFNCGDLAESVRYYEQALALNQTLNDRAAMSSIWANLTWSGGSYIVETLIGDPTSLSEAARIGEPARQLAREIGWRAGEAYALVTLGQTYGYRGDYGRALGYTFEALTIAEAIAHREWMAAANCGLSHFYLDLLTPASALPHAVAALDLAQRAGSGIWRGLTTAVLATVHLAQGELQAAEAVLASVARVERATYTLVERNCRLATARLELALGEPARALQFVDDLIVTVPNLACTGLHALPPLLLVRADALVALGREVEAERVLQTAQAGATVKGAASLLWRILSRLAALYHRQGRYAEAATAVTAAWGVIEQIESAIPEPVLRATLIQGAGRQFPELALPRRNPSARAVGGLTAREMEVAQLIAQGRSNREIAAQLVITERTVTTHIRHIFDKLDFHARTQIAVWAAGQDLRASDF